MNQVRVKNSRWSPQEVRDYTPNSSLPLLALYDSKGIREDDPEFRMAFLNAFVDLSEDEVALCESFENNSLKNVALYVMERAAVKQLDRIAPDARFDIATGIAVGKDSRIQRGIDALETAVDREIDHRRAVKRRIWEYSEPAYRSQIPPPAEYRQSA